MQASESLSVARLMAPVNELLMPGIRAGLANPLPLTAGFVILEVAGRRTGQLRTVPLLCTDYGSVLMISTVRESSQWLKNLAAADQAHVWLRGRRRTVRPHVYRRGVRLSAGSDPGNCWSAAARSLSQITGASVAALSLTDIRTGTQSA